MIAPISAEERADRARTVFNYVGADVAALVLFDDQFIQYYTDFVFHPTERPVALIISCEGERTLFVSELEREHAAQAGQLEHVITYPEYPGKEHPLELLCQHLNVQGVAHHLIGVDHDGYPPVMGYTGPPLSERLRIERVSAGLDRQLSLKSAHEIALIRESARWGHRAHELLQAYTAPGKTETEVEGQATREATQEMNAALGPDFKSRNRWLGGAVALYRGQVGVNSALPHAVNINATFAVGDTLVTGAGAGVYGYLSELERTMFLGAPNAEQRTYFAHMLALQDLAFERLRPGVTCARIDEALRGYYEREGLTSFWRHHVGHSLGQRIHESPFLDIGDETVLEPSMVLSVEPGLYIPGLGGFRHSDTVLITATGIEKLTDYPRDIHSLTIKV